MKYLQVSKWENIPFYILSCCSNPFCIFHQKSDLVIDQIKRNKGHLNQMILQRIYGEQKIIWMWNS
ncbi:unnamed protein product [Schistosoma mattheei]|uniref:Uncharacterized protein n=2 Tax=Schistosoma TaxID=6181 RepID=A0A183KKJ3_9TREM|nr:unnamed protein product [Schistosoma mattheei]VDP59527.1 unnamed protein product [Schistosoma curassoni]